jgi:hypothetical protein
MPTPAQQPDCYAEQRALIIQRAPPLAEILPEQPPPALSVPRHTLAQRRQILLQPANNHAQLLFIFGWGDGSILLDCCSDPLLRRKQIIVLIFAGEEQAFAHTFTTPVMDRIGALSLHLYRIRSRKDFDWMSQIEFAKHHEVARLAGADFISGHPLCAEAEAFRAERLESYTNVLADRTYTFGNSIMDSFNGVENVCVNAPLLLTAPDLTACKGIFGTTPIISIAAGPSLKEHIDELRALQDRCILIACDAVMNGLVEAGIEPHFCTPLERVTWNSPMVQKARGTRTIFAGPMVVHGDTIAPFEGRALGVLGIDALYEWLQPDEKAVRVGLGMSTGVFSVVLARVLGTGPVYLLGHDLAYQDDQSHWGGSDYASKSMAEYTKSDVTTSDNDRRRVPGNAGGMISSMTLWDKFRHQIGVEGLLFALDSRPFYNVNAHYKRGAVIENAAPAPLPAPDSLPMIQWPAWPAQNTERLENWRTRARGLPKDCAAFRDHFSALRADIDDALAKGPKRWDAHGLAERANLEAPISADNKKMFRYMFGPSFHNCMASIQLMRKQSCLPQIHFEILQALRSLCLTFEAAITILEPRILELSRG